MSIKEFEKEDIIFHFTKKTSALEGILPKGKLNFSLLKNFHDPYEYSAFIQIAFGGDISLQTTNENWKKLSLAFNEYALNKIKIISFSMNEHQNQKFLKDISCNYNKEYFPYPLDSPYKNLRMWIQYGENQKGVCLVFSKSKLLSYIENKFKDFESIKNHVHYMKNESLPHVSGDLNIDFNNQQEVLNFIKQEIDKILINKSSDFIDEQEYRIWIHDLNNNVENIDIKNILIGIIIGDRFPLIDYPNIKEFCKNYNVPFYKAMFDVNQLVFYQQ